MITFLVKDNHFWKTNEAIIIFVILALSGVLLFAVFCWFWSPENSRLKKWSKSKKIEHEIEMEILKLMSSKDKLFKEIDQLKEEIDNDQDLSDEKKIKYTRKFDKLKRDLNLKINSKIEKLKTLKKEEKIISKEVKKEIQE